MEKQKKILMIIAPRDFRDEEYFIPKEILEKRGFKVETGSTVLGIAYGKLGGEASVDLLLEKIEVQDYQAIVFAGGPGAYNYFENLEAHRIIKEASRENIVLAAICIAPVILAKAGVLKDKKATVWTSPLDSRAVKYLEEGEATYVAEKVVADGQIITACGPEAAREFAQAIVSKIT